MLAYYKGHVWMTGIRGMVAPVQVCLRYNVTIITFLANWGSYRGAYSSLSALANNWIMAWCQVGAPSASNMSVNLSTPDHGLVSFRGPLASE